MVNSQQIDLCTVWGLASCVVRLLLPGTRLCLITQTIDTTQCISPENLLCQHIQNLLIKSTMTLFTFSRKKKKVPVARHHGFLFPLALLSQIVCESQFHEQWESPRSASLYWPSCCLTTAANWEWHPSLPLSRDGNMNEHTQTHMHPHALDMCTHRLSHVTTFREKKLALHVFEYVFFFHSVLKVWASLKRQSCPHHVHCLLYSCWNGLSPQGSIIMGPCDASVWTSHLLNHRKAEVSHVAHLGTLGSCIFLNWTFHLEFTEIRK